MPVNVVGVKLEESVNRRVAFAAQTLVDSFAHHCPLFARNGEHVVFGVLQKLLAKSHVQVLLRPIGALGCPVSQLEMVDAKLVRKSDRRFDQGPFAARIACRRATVCTERQRNE